MHEVTIGRVLNGYIVRVGCQMLVFQKMDEMLEELRLYLENPLKSRQLWEGRVDAYNAVAGEQPAEQEQPSGGVGRGRISRLSDKQRAPTGVAGAPAGGEPVDEGDQNEAL